MDTQDMSLTFVKAPEDITRLNNWIFDTIYPYIKGRTLEIGSGSGELASLFTMRQLPIHLTDEHDTNREKLRKTFEGVAAMRAVHDMDFKHPMFQKKYASEAGVFSTILAVNIVEHGGYNKQMLHHAAYFLAAQGHFIIVTSAKAVFFNPDGPNLEDLKEYNYKVARSLMGESFEILKVRYFNWSAERENGSFNGSGLYTLAIFRKT